MRFFLLCLQVRLLSSPELTQYRPLVRNYFRPSFRGLKGTVQMVNTLADEAEELLCFYLVALEGTPIQEPVWFERDEVEAAEVVASPLMK